MPVWPVVHAGGARAFVRAAVGIECAGSCAARSYAVIAAARIAFSGAARHARAAAIRIAVVACGKAGAGAANAHVSAAALGRGAAGGSAAYACSAHAIGAVQGAAALRGAAIGRSVSAGAGFADALAGHCLGARAADAAQAGAAVVARAAVLAPGPAAHDYRAGGCSAVAGAVGCPEGEARRLHGCRGAADQAGGGSEREACRQAAACYRVCEAGVAAA